MYKLSSSAQKVLVTILVLLLIALMAIGFTGNVQKDANHSTFWTAGQLVGVGIRHNIVEFGAEKSFRAYTLEVFVKKETIPDGSASYYTRLIEWQIFVVPEGKP
ncbi:MAG: hypothetical protein ACOZAO_00390 [Patescibacteria group bacterium]